MAGNTPSEMVQRCMTDIDAVARRAYEKSKTPRDKIHQEAVSDSPELLRYCCRLVDNSIDVDRDPLVVIVRKLRGFRESEDFKLFGENSFDATLIGYVSERLEFEFTQYLELIAVSNHRILDSLRLLRRDMESKVLHMINLSNVFSAKDNGLWALVTPYNKARCSFPLLGCSNGAAATTTSQVLWWQRKMERVVDGGGGNAGESEAELKAWHHYAENVLAVEMIKWVSDRTVKTLYEQQVSWTESCKQLYDTCIRNCEKLATDTVDFECDFFDPATALELGSDHKQGLDQLIDKYKLISNDKRQLKARKRTLEESQVFSQADLDVLVAFVQPDSSMTVNLTQMYTDIINCMGTATRSCTLTQEQIDRCSLDIDKDTLQSVRRLYELMIRTHHYILEEQKKALDADIRRKNRFNELAVPGKRKEVQEKGRSILNNAIELDAIGCVLYARSVPISSHFEQNLNLMKVQLRAAYQQSVEGVTTEKLEALGSCCRQIRSLVIKVNEVEAFVKERSAHSGGNGGVINSFPVPVRGATPIVRNFLNCLVDSSKDQTLSRYIEQQANLLVV